MESHLSGLSAREVEARRSRGEDGRNAVKITKSRGRIVRENLLTLFNFLNCCRSLFEYAFYCNHYFEYCDRHCSGI